MQPRTALVTGATGLVGSRLLALLVGDPVYEHVVTLGRRVPALSGAKLENRLFEDATQATYECGVVFCCLGTTIKKAGSRARFKAVDHDLVLDVARRARAAGTDTFLVVSSLGADPRAGNFYLRTKGEMEAALADVGFARLGIVRPSLLLGSRKESRPGEAVAQAVARVFNPVLVGPLRRYRAVTAEEVAAALVTLDQSDFSGARIVESDELTAPADRSGAFS